MNPSTTTVRLITLSIVAFALLAFITFSIWKVGKENAETARLANLLEESEVRTNTLQSIQALQISLGSEIEAFEKLTLTNERLVPLIESIENVGRTLKLDLSILSVEKKEGVEGDAFPKIRITIDAQGAWNGVFSLVEAIETLPYRVMIERVTLIKKDLDWSTMIILSLHSFN